MTYIYHDVNDFELGTTDDGVPMANVVTNGSNTVEVYETTGIRRYDPHTAPSMCNVSGGNRTFLGVKYSRNLRVLEITVG